MFAIISGGEIAKLVSPGTAFEWDGNQYPANWCNLSSPEEKAAIGMVDVVYAARPDDRYYWVSEDAPAINGNVVEVNYTSTAKDLAGLQDQLTKEVNQAAYVLLAPTDYIDIRNLRDPAYKPEWMTWRDAVRTAASAVCADISAATDVSELQQVMADLSWPLDPDAEV